MIKEYQFFGEPPIFFDDAKSVEALIKYAFEQFDCYEPCGIKLFHRLEVLQKHDKVCNVRKIIHL